MLRPSARLFPIGYIISVDAPNFDPHNFYVGGNWERIKGRVIVGVDEAQTEFDTTGKTGGSKFTELHTHNVLVDGNQVGVAFGAGTGGLNYNTTLAATTAKMMTSSFGTGDSGNLQPYQTAYVWKLISYSN